MMDGAVFTGISSNLQACVMSTVPILIAQDDGQSIVIDRPAIIVGRSRRRSDVRINHESISAVHCEICVGESCLQIRNRGRNGIRINGQKTDEGVLQEGDTLEIARLKFRVLMAGDPDHHNAASSSRNNDWLVRLAGMELGPMPWAELALMVQRGELTKSDEVRWSGQRTWRPAATADGLFDSEEPTSPENSPATTDNELIARRIVKVFPLKSEPTDPPETAPQLVNAADEEPWNGQFDSINDAPDTSTPETESLADTGTDLLDETATSANRFVLARPNSREDTATDEDSFGAAENDADRIDDRRGNEQWDNDSTPPLDNGDSAEDLVDLEDIEELTESEAKIAGWLGEQVEPFRLPPPLPDSPPMPVSPPPVRPLPVAPPFKPIVGRSDTFFDRVYDTVLEPVLYHFPILKKWPVIASIVAGIAIVIFLMQPSYKGSRVSGMVTLQGQPLSNATITFTDLKHGFGASAVINEEGSFEVITLNGGMKPGSYSVAVMPMKEESPAVVSELQRQYMESQDGAIDDETLLMAADESGTTELAEGAIDLPPTTIPFRYRSIQTSGILRDITSEGPNELLIELVAGALSE
jgi:hypothetical protein